MARMKDPICGMSVESEGARFTSQREGKTVYFCSAHCKTRFDANPGLRPPSS